MEERVVKHFEIDPFYIYTTLTYSQMVKVNEATNKTTQPLTYSQMVKVNEATNKIYACSLSQSSNCFSIKDIITLPCLLVNELKQFVDFHVAFLVFLRAAVENDLGATISLNDGHGIPTGPTRVVLEAQPKYSSGG